MELRKLQNKLILECDKCYEENKIGNNANVLYMSFYRFDMWCVFHHLMKISVDSVLDYCK